MVDSDLLDFIPVPLRSRRGWTPERQREFVAWLRRGLRPGRATERVGITRQSAYWLRTRPGAESFAAAWDGALDAARERKMALREPTEWQRAIAGVLEPIRYRGRIVAWRRRFDNRALIRLFGRQCRLNEKREAEGANYFRPGMPGLCQNPRPPDGDALGRKARRSAALPNRESQAGAEPSPSLASRCGTAGIRRWPRPRR